MKTLLKLTVLFLFIAAGSFAGTQDFPQWQYAKLTHVHTAKQNDATLTLPKEQRTVQLREALEPNLAYRDKFFHTPDALNDKRDATPSLIDLLNLDFGSNGWELVSVEDSQVFTIYTFKRKIELPR